MPKDPMAARITGSLLQYQNRKYKCRRWVLPQAMWVVEILIWALVYRSAELSASGMFSDLFSTCFEMWTWNFVYIQPVGGTTHQVKVSLQLVLFDPLYNQKYLKFVFNTWRHQLYEASKFALTLIKWVFWLLLIFVIARGLRVKKKGQIFTWRTKAPNFFCG